MKHDQVSERGVTSAHRTTEKEEEEEEEDEDEEEEEGRVRLSLFLRVVDIRTRIRRLGE